MTTTSRTTSKAVSRGVRRGIKIATDPSPARWSTLQASSRPDRVTGAWRRVGKALDASMEGTSPSRRSR